MSTAAQPSLQLVRPAFWDDACKHLMKKDRVMKRLIPQFKDASLQTRGNAFVTLARSIVAANFCQGRPNSVGSLCPADAANDAQTGTEA